MNKQVPKTDRNSPFHNLKKPFKTDSFQSLIIFPESSELNTKKYLILKQKNYQVSNFPDLLSFTFLGLDLVFS